MPNLKEVKLRIGSVKKTKQITSAMKLVAGAKLKRATDRASAAQPYQERLAETLSRVAARAGESVSHPLLVRRESIKRVRLVVLTSDRGLCGPFNNQLLRRTVDWLDERKAEGVEVEVHVYGRKGRDFLNSRKVAIAQTVLDLSQKDRLELVREIADAGVAAFAAGEVDQVVVAYNKFVNTLTQRPTFSQVVPVSVPAGSGEDALVDYLYEPGPAALFANLLPLYLRTQILQSVLETEAGEHAARMAAMDSATKNANDLINRLTLVYNRARQAAITTEITEIVSGAEAL